MELNNLTKLNGTTRSKKRVGRGIGSGKGGHTSGRGQKGQKSRVGVNIPFGFEGGQVPLFKKLPLIGGFKNSRSKKYTIAKLGQFEVFKNGTEVTPQLLMEKRIINRVGRNGVKILGTGKFTKNLVLKGFIATESAKKVIEETGSKLIRY